MPLISALKRKRHVDLCEFKVSLVHIVNPVSKRKEKRNIKAPRAISISN